jgi:fructoselysine-6-P-deglycase FrlB-like protein
MIGAKDAELAAEIEATGAAVLSGAADDPLIELALAQRLAVRIADARGLNPDRPRHLTRSIVLS